jgi:hypothetical protein
MAHALSLLHAASSGVYLTLMPEADRSPVPVQSSGNGFCRVDPPHLHVAIAHCPSPSRTLSLDLLPRNRPIWRQRFPGLLSISVIQLRLTHTQRRSLGDAACFGHHSGSLVEDCDLAAPLVGHARASHGMSRYRSTPINSMRAKGLEEESILGSQLLEPCS